MKKAKTEKEIYHRHFVSQTGMTFEVFGVDDDKTKCIGYLQYTIGEYLVENKDRQLKPSSDEDMFSRSNRFYNSIPRLDVLTLQVLEDYRGKGIGSALMDAAVKYANERGYSLFIPIETKQHSSDGNYGNSTGFYRKYFATRDINLDSYATGGGVSGIHIYHIPSAAIASAARSIELQTQIEEEERTTANSSFTL